MLSILKKEPQQQEADDPQLAALENEDRELQVLEAEYARLRGAKDATAAVVKQTEDWLKRVENDGQLLLTTTDEIIEERYRKKRRELREAAAAANAFVEFERANPNLQQQREDLNARRDRHELNRTIRRLANNYFESVAPAIMTACRLLIEHTKAKEELCRRHNITIQALGIAVDAAPFSKDLDLADIADYFKLERLFHRREQVEAGDNSRAVRTLHLLEAQGVRPTAPRWTWG